MRRLAIVVLLLVSSAPLIAGASPFAVDELLEGVWLFRVPADSAEYTNSLVIDRDQGLLVVESQPSPAAAKQLLEAIGEVSDKPIRYLVLSHPHVESSGGASAFPDSTLIIGSHATYEALADETTELGADIPLRSSDPDAWVAPPRVLPGLIVGGGFSLRDGSYPVELRTVARGHYPGSIVVLIEEPGLHYIGALVAADRNPHADTDLTNVSAWVSWINSLLFSRPKTIVPIRGEALDSDELRGFRNALSWLVSRLDYALIERIPHDEIVEFTLAADGFDKHFDLEVEPSFVRGLIERELERRQDDPR